MSLNQLLSEICSPGDRRRYPRLGGEADAVYGELLLVNMVIIFKDVTQVPDLDIIIIACDNMTVTLMLLSREEVITQLSEVRGITSRILWKWAEITLTRASVSSAQM